MSERRLALYRRAAELLRWLRLVVGVGVLGVSSFALLGWVAAARQAAVAERELPRERSEWKKLRQSVDEARSRARRSLPAGAESGEVLTSSVVAELKRAAEGLGIRVLAVQQIVPTETPDGESDQPVGMDLSLEGSFEAVHAFLRHVHRQPLPLTIQAIDLRPLPGGAGTGLTVQLKTGVVLPKE
jgi:hypothetical protein